MSWDDAHKSDILAERRELAEAKRPPQHAHIRMDADEQHVHNVPGFQNILPIVLDS